MELVELIQTTRLTQRANRRFVDTHSSSDLRITPTLFGQLLSLTNLGFLTNMHGARLDRTKIGHRERVLFGAIEIRDLWVFQPILLVLGQNLQERHATLMRILARSPRIPTRLPKDAVMGQ